MALVGELGWGNGARTAVSRDPTRRAALHDDDEEATRRLSHLFLSFLPTRPAHLSRLFRSSDSLPVSLTPPTFRKLPMRFVSLSLSLAALILPHRCRNYSSSPTTHFVSPAAKRPLPRVSVDPTGTDRRTDRLSACLSLSILFLFFLLLLLLLLATLHRAPRNFVRKLTWKERSVQFYFFLFFSAIPERERGPLSSDDWHAKSRGQSVAISSEDRWLFARKFCG